MRSRVKPWSNFLVQVQAFSGRCIVLITELVWSGEDRLSIIRSGHDEGVVEIFGHDET